MAVKIIKKYISEEDCKKYYSYLDLNSRKSERPEIINALGYPSSYVASQTNEKTGVIHGVDHETNKALGRLFVQVKETAEEFFGEKLDLHQASYQVLLTGAHNPLHSDSTDLEGNPIQEDGTPEELEWSGLLYLNNYDIDFTGGILSFPQFNLDYFPKAGDLVIFKGDVEHLHSVSRVNSGERKNLVFFWSKRGNVSDKNFFEERNNLEN